MPMPQGGRDGRLPRVTVPGWKGLLLGGALERIAFGVGALSAPSRVNRLCQVEAEEDTPAAGYLMRLVGVRNIVLGAATLAASRNPPAARIAIGANLACQLGDGVALAQELKQRRRLDGPTAAGLAFSVIGLAVWGGAVAQAPRPRRRRRPSLWRHNSGGSLKRFAERAMPDVKLPKKLRIRG